jgi:exosortase/archaeosortase family protein
MLSSRLPEVLKMSRAYAFLLSITVAYLVPLAIPNVGIDDPYFFIMVLVLAAWFVMKWDTVKTLTARGSTTEVVVGASAIVAVYAYKAAIQATVGLLDLLVIFAAVVLAFYGIKSFKLFWVPATYGIVLLLGYQLENILPNYVALQDWMAGVMASSMHVFGIKATVSGHIVTLNSGLKLLALNVEGDCTGLQGILAFGMLSTMALLDMKPRMSRLIPIFALGFIGAFFINIARLFLVFVTFEFFGPSLGNAVHVYAGYTLFIVWVFAFWILAFRYLGTAPQVAPGTFVQNQPASPSIGRSK